MGDPVAPHSIEAERAILGSALVNPGALHDVIDAIEAKDFYRDAHRRIYLAMLDVTERGGAVDFITVRDRLGARGDLEDIGGPAYLASLTDGMPRSANVAHYAGIVRHDAVLRGVIQAANLMLQEAKEADAEAEAVLDQAERAIFEIAQRTVRGDFIDAGQLVQEGIPAVQVLIETKKGVTGIPSGFVDFDDMTRGFQPGSLALLAARPSMGKTAWALNVAYHVAAAGRVVGFFSIEMSRQELFMRLLASVARVDGHRLQSGYMNQSDYDRISHGFAQIAETKLCVDDSPNLSVLDVRGKARRLKARKGLDLVIVDYLQLMQLPKSENRNLAVADVSRALKLLARELEIPVLALSQLSRGVETRGDKRPMMSDLRDSGALEQDADLIVFLHRPEVYEPHRDDLAGLAEAIIAKQRNGPTGTVKLQWVKETTRFENRN